MSFRDGTKFAAPLGAGAWRNGLCACLRGDTNRTTPQHSDGTSTRQPTRVARARVATPPPARGSTVYYRVYPRPLAVRASTRPYPVAKRRMVHDRPSAPPLSRLDACTCTPISDRTATGTRPARNRSKRYCDHGTPLSARAYFRGWLDCPSHRCKSAWVEPLQRAPQ